LLFLFFRGLADAVTFLSAGIPFFTTPQSLHYCILVLQKPSRAEHQIWIIVGVVTCAVPTELLLGLNAFFHCDSSITLKSLSFRLGTRLKSLPSLSMTEATITGKTIIASPTTMTLSASPFSFPQLTVSSRVDPDSPPVSGRSRVITTA